MHEGLYYLDEGGDEIALATCMSPTQELLLHHRRLGHLSFAAMSRIYPSLNCVLENPLYAMHVN